MSVLAAVFAAAFVGTPKVAGQVKAVGSKPSLNLVHVYSKGDADRFTFVVTDVVTDRGTGASRTTRTLGFIVDTVIKVDQDGNADIREGTQSASANLGAGGHQSKPTEATDNFSVDKYGHLVGNPPSTPVGWVMFASAIPDSNAPLELSKSVAFVRVMGGISMEGSIRIAELTDTMAKLSCSLTWHNSPFPTETTLVRGTLVWNKEKKRYDRADFLFERRETDYTDKMSVTVERTK